MGKTLENMTATFLGGQQGKILKMILRLQVNWIEYSINPTSSAYDSLRDSLATARSLLGEATTIADKKLVNCTSCHVTMTVLQSYFAAPVCETCLRARL